MLCKLFKSFVHTFKKVSSDIKTSETMNVSDTVSQNAGPETYKSALVLHFGNKTRWIKMYFQGATIYLIMSKV